MAVVLAYHRIAVHESDPFDLCTSPQRFREQLAVIRKVAEPVPLLEILEARTPRAVALTFDDGFRDSLDAATWLAESRIPGTVFVNSAELETPHEAWWDLLSRIFCEPGPLPTAFDFTGERLATTTLTERTMAMRRLHQSLFEASGAARAGLLEQIVSWSGRSWPTRPSHRLLVAEEVRQLAAIEGMSIGAHGAQHLRLPALQDEKLWREIADCRSELEALLGRRIEIFSYPYGAWDGRCRAAVLRGGFRMAFTVDGRSLNPSDDPLTLPRMLAPPLDGDAFAAWLEAAFSS